MRMAMVAVAVLMTACGQSAVAPEEGAIEAPEPNGADADSDNVPSEKVIKAPDVHPCRMQDGQQVAAVRLKAIGTEPFWSAAIDGRCVTYSTPENQVGTRIWTHFVGDQNAGLWEGNLGGQRFVLETRRDSNCSDGMSDRTYPLAVTLTIGRVSSRGGQEERRGCAAPE